MIDELESIKIHPIPNDLPGLLQSGKEVIIRSDPLKHLVYTEIKGSLILTTTPVPYEAGPPDSPIHGTHKWELVVSRIEVVWNFDHCCLNLLVASVDNALIKNNTLAK